MENSYGIIYCATNSINNKKYIGQTVNTLKQRKREHLSSAKRGDRFSFQKAINKYGKDNFTWEIIDYADNQEELDKKEIYWIKFYRTFYDGGYNMTPGGQITTSDDPEERSLASGGKKFLVFDINGNYIKSTISQIEFAKEIGVSSSTIQNVLNGEKHSTNGYILIIEDEFTEELLTYKIKMSNQCYKPFIVLDKQNKPMGIWYDKKTCSETIRLDLRSIQRQLKKNRFSKYAREYTLFYLDSIPDEFQDIKLKINNNEIPFCESKRMERYYKEVI